jgi:hypothetical protein
MFKIETDQREIKPDSIVLLKGFDELQFDFEPKCKETDEGYQQELEEVNAYIEEIQGKEAIIDEIFVHIEKDLQRFTIKRKKTDPLFMFEVGSIKQIIKS